MTLFPPHLNFKALQTVSGLKELDNRFLSFLKESSPNLVLSLQQARLSPERLSRKDESALILELAPFLEDFLANQFAIETTVQALQKRHHDLAPLMTCKRQFVQRRVAPRYARQEVEELDPQKWAPFLAIDDKSFADQVLKALQDKDDVFLQQAEQYSAWRCFAKKAAPFKKRSPLFTLPLKQEVERLFPFERVRDGTLGLPDLKGTSPRDGFNLIDPGIGFKEAVSEADYCLYCHQRDKDSCAKGFPEKNHPGNFTKNPLGVPLTGCPLEQKISEMNLLRQQGLCLGALATAMIDNPLLAATGERICNDCEKACIFQKQDPVKVPSIETQTLREVLALPWGIELYDLLTQWNPLNFRAPLPKEASGYQILVAGLGPAGFTLAHYLMREGHSVVAIDGLKIEPFPRKAFQPIQEAQKDLFDSLEDRIIGGFGGVAEYGITARWDKNFLTLIRIVLERRQRFKVMGGVRLGSQITPQEAIALGFDHVALCLGAGRPQLLNLPNLMSKGVRMASDFLMTLQLSGAYKKETLTNLQIRLPAVVVGGGLTAMDTATEVLAYYPRQVETFLSRYEQLAKASGEAVVRRQWTDEETEIADVFLNHGRAIKEERRLATLQGRSPDFRALVSRWGGVKLLYRRPLTQSPAYRLNHHEVHKALQEGLVIQEETVPVGLNLDEHEALSSIDVLCGPQKDKETLPAKSLFLALGTQPNVVLAKECPELLSLDGDFFQGMTPEGESISLSEGPKSETTTPFVKTTGDLKHRLSFFGDLHPSFSGSVVKAMASAKKGYPSLTQHLQKKPPRSTQQEVFKTVESEWQAKVVSVTPLGPKIVEILVKAPAAARHFSPGHFFRLQNFETLPESEDAMREGSPRPPKLSLAMEGLALTGASADPQTGLISLIVLEMGGSSSLCRFLRPGEPVVLMGPTGEGTKFAGCHPVLMGGGLGNAVLFSIGKALRHEKKEVLYVAAYKTADAIFKPEELEEASDRLLWCVEEGQLPFKKRPQDLFFQGNILEALSHHQAVFRDRDSLLVIGSDRMMHAVQGAVQGSLQQVFENCRTFTASINSPMQCMMKEICAQCLQVHKDPDTGEESFLFTCASQDQPLKKVDFNVLKNRLSQNSLQEKMTALWQEHCLKKVSE